MAQKSFGAGVSKQVRSTSLVMDRKEHCGSDQFRTPTILSF